MMNSFGQGSFRSLSEGLQLSMNMSSESVFHEAGLMSKSLTSDGTLSMKLRMISGADCMTLIVVRSLIMEVELKLTNIPPKSMSLYCSLMSPESLHMFLTCSMSSSTVSGTLARFILSELSPLNKMRSHMGFAILTNQVGSQVGLK